jgi:hypothetical protein
MVEDAMRSVEIINRTCSLYKKGAPQRELVNINEVITRLLLCCAMKRLDAASPPAVTSVPISRKSWEIASSCSRYQ